MQKPFCLQTQVVLVLLPLFQFDPNRKLRMPIAFFSRKLSKAQLKYAIFDKEVLAIYESVKIFIMYARWMSFYHTL